MNVKYEKRFTQRHLIYKKWFAHIPHSIEIPTKTPHPILHASRRSSPSNSAAAFSHMNAVKLMRAEHQQQQTTPILSKIKPLMFIGSALTAFLPRMSTLHTEKMIMPELVKTFILCRPRSNTFTVKMTPHFSIAHSIL
jgi:hypothetical protein